MMKVIAFLLASVLSFPLWAQQPATTNGDDDLESEVVIDGKRYRGRITEGRTIDGKRFLKIEPAKGPAFYLIDEDDDGNVDVRRNELSPKLMVPSWVIFSW